jgi:hypothetical protein
MPAAPLTCTACGRPWLVAQRMMQAVYASGIGAMGV